MKDVIEYLQKKLDSFPRIPLSLTPTPCHRLNHSADNYETWDVHEIIPRR